MQLIAGELGLPNTQFVKDVIDVEECMYGISELRSAYPEDTPYTVCTKEETAVRDYIVYKADKLSRVGVMSMLDAGQIQANDYLPSPDWPSSHVSLLAMLEITQPTVLQHDPTPVSTPISNPVADEETP